MKFAATHRGFSHATFFDLDGSECSIQKSSAATIDAIHFGVKNHRMHLSQDKVIGLLAVLGSFAEHPDRAVDVMLKDLYGENFRIAGPYDDCDVVLMITEVSSDATFYLNRALINELRPVLMKFVETGELPAPQ